MRNQGAAAVHPGQHTRHSRGVEFLPVLVAAVVAVLAYLAIVLADRRGSFWLAFVATLVPLEYVDRYFVDLPSALKWLPELSLVGAGVAALVLAPPARAPLPRGPLVAALLCFLVALVSKAVNHSSPVALLVSQRGLILFFAALLAQRAATGLYAVERRHAFLVGAGVVSAGVCLLQRVTVARSEPDRVTGLFSLGEVVLFFHLCVIVLVLAYWVEGRRVGRWRVGFVVPWMVLSLAIGNQEAAFPYLGLVFVYFLVRARRRRVALLSSGAALGAATLLVFASLYDTQYRAESERGFTDSLFSWAYLQRYFLGERHDVFTPSGDLLRGAAVVTAYREIEGSGTTLALGRGPGATSESALAGAGGPLALQYPGIGRVTLSLLLGEVGFVGLAAHLFFLLVVLRAGRVADEPPERRLYREAILLLALAYLVYVRMVYEPIFAWVLAGLLPLAAGVRRESPAPPQSAPSGSSIRGTWRIHEGQSEPVTRPMRRSS